MLKKIGLRARFIPVGTGNTGNVITMVTYSSVHPRGHGEPGRFLIQLLAGIGSSPWARGTPRCRCHSHLQTRFIPVGTGNTQGRIDQHQRLSVHPRGHGEHFDIDHYAVDVNGSSPWARGTQNPDFDLQISNRFIPVGTGNTTVTLANAQMIPVHPRGHGEHASTKLALSSEYGSSPWARGTLYLSLAVIAAFRFIPVGTGNTSSTVLRVCGASVHPRGHGEHSARAKVV